MAGYITLAFIFGVLFLSDRIAKAVDGMVTAREQAMAYEIIKARGEKNIHMEDALDKTMDGYMKKYKLTDDTYVYLYEVLEDEEKVKIRIITDDKMGNLTTRKIKLENDTLTFTVLGKKLFV